MLYVRSDFGLSFFLLDGAGAKLLRRPGLFLLFSGQPPREPITWGESIVMNTRQELQQAFAELDNNTFISGLSFSNNEESI